MDELDRKIDKVLNNMRKKVKKEKLSDEFKEKLIKKLEEYEKSLK